MAKKVFTDESLQTFIDEIKSYTDDAVSTKADSSHNHAASNITSGTLSSDRLPTVPISKGGTGATTAASALTNLGLTATAAELNYMDGVTSNVQTQLNNKASNDVVTTSSNGLMSAEDKVKLNNLNIAYGTCATAAATAEKVVTIDNINWQLEVGSIIVVKFANSNSATNVTLNVNSTGAKQIYYNSAIYTSSSTNVCGYANRHTLYMYNGSQWVWITHGNENDTNTYQRLYPTTTNKEYPITARYNTTTGSSYYNEYGRYSTGVTLNPSTNKITASGGFVGDLEGNATSADTLTDLTATVTELNVLDGITATTTELNYTDGVTSNIQTQLDNKVPTTRTVNGKALSSNITLTATDVGADASGSASSALASAKTYADSAAATIKNDLLNGAGEAYDTLKELGDLIDTNVDAIEALETVATGKMDKTNPTGTGSFSMNRATDTTVGSRSFAAGYNVEASGTESIAIGYQTKATATGAFAEGGMTTASGMYSHAEARNTTASGDSSHAEGNTTIASGIEAHAEGRRTEASGHYGAHAEGMETYAKGYVSHTEGYGTIAAEETWMAHAEGEGSLAGGNNSHAEGTYTITNSISQHAQGEYNIADSGATSIDTRGTYAHIVGNGTSEDSRSNAHTLDWEGNAWFSGDVYVGSSSGINKDSGSKKLINEEDVATTSTAGLMSASDKSKLDNGGIPIVTTSGDDGVTYTATVDGITALTAGMKITIIPNVVSTTTTPKLNVNSLGEKYIRMPVTYNTSATSIGSIASWLAKGKPITLEYDGTYWKTISLPRPSAQYLYGAVPIANGGTGGTTAEAARVNLGAVTRVTFSATLSTTWSGSEAPYSQTVSVSGILASDMPHIAPVYDSDYETALLQMEAWKAISYASTADGTITFDCYEDKPTVAITVQVEVFR